MKKEYSLPEVEIEKLKKLSKVNQIAIMKCFLYIDKVITERLY